MVAIVNGAEGDRTPDLSVANAALSHLSYGPEMRGDATELPRRSGAKSSSLFDLLMDATGWPSAILRDCHFDLQLQVGATGFEPVTSTMST